MQQHMVWFTLVQQHSVFGILLSILISHRLSPHPHIPNPTRRDATVQSSNVVFASLFDTSVSFLPELFCLFSCATPIFFVFFESSIDSCVQSHIQQSSVIPILYFQYLSTGEKLEKRRFSSSILIDQ